MARLPENAPLITLKNVPTSSKSAPEVVAVDNFSIIAGQNWAIVGGNGSGKTTFAKMLAGQNGLTKNQRMTRFHEPNPRISLISFEAEQALLEREIYEDDSDNLDRIDQGRTTFELITELLVDSVDLDGIIDSLQLQNFLQTGFRILSTGERRRMMIARALSQAPGMLVLDEPYDGLDIAFTTHLKKLIAQLSQELPVVIIVNRMSHIGAHITDLACLHDMKLVLQGPRAEIEKSKLWAQLQGMHVTLPPLPSALASHEPFQPKKDQAIVEMRSVSVGYHDKQIMRDLDWKIMPGEQWKVSGPNGSGKSTLVNLVSGDHPQCYSNEIYLFGQRRGKGESIWEIKHHMGLMSTALHQQYRVSVNVETVLLSGFFDSIGVYRGASAEQKKIAHEWLEFLQLQESFKTSFKSLSFGQQRMLLIARALIKRPFLIILDEPCQGLDPINRALVLQLIENIVERKIAQIIYISHDDEDRLACISHHLNFVAKDEAAADEPKYEIEIFCISDNATDHSK